MKSRIIVASEDCVYDIVDDIAMEGYNLLAIEERINSYGEYVIVYEGNDLDGWDSLEDDDYINEEEKETIRKKFGNVIMDISLYPYLGEIGEHVMDLYYSGKLMVNGERCEEEEY